MHINLSRKSAFGTHLLASIAVFTTLVATILLLWYPSPLMETDGSWEGLRIAALVDIVLGPTLTLMIYKPGKPGLKKDMAFIIALQVSALCWGAWVIHDQRPALLVYADDQLQAIPLSIAREVIPADKLSSLTRNGMPGRVAVDMPTDPIAFADFLRSRTANGGSIHRSHQDFVPWDNAWQTIRQNALDIDHYTADKPAWQANVATLATRLNRPMSDLVFLPLVGRKATAIVVADSNSGDFLAHLDIPYDMWVARKLSDRKPGAERRNK